MPVTGDYRERIESLLSAVTPIKMRSMFGGVGIYSGTHFFALIDDDMLYFKVDDSNRGDFDNRGMEPFSPMGPDKPMSYYRVPEDLLDKPSLLREWVNKSLAVARRKPKKAPRKKRR